MVRRMTRPRPLPSTTHWADIAAAQHGIISREQASAAGWTEQQIDNELTRGTWVPVRPGVYRSTSTPETWHQRAMAACIGRVRAIAVSHHSAAFLHDLVELPPEPPDVIAAQVTSTRGLGRIARVRRLRALPGAREIVTIASLPVTSLPRTLADLAGVTTNRELRELVDRAVRSLRLDWERVALLRSVQELAAGRHGADAVRSAVAPWTLERGGSRKMQSVLEAQVLRILLAARIPAPTCQYPVVLPDGRRCYLDFAWPQVRIALEVDGYAFHSDRDTFEHDRQRGNHLLALGWQILHTTAGEIRRNPQSLLDVLGGVLS